MGAILHPFFAIYDAALSKSDAYLTALSALTLGELWQSINYHPFPRSWNIAITVVILLGQVPRLLRWLATRRTSRRVVGFEWNVPPVRRVEAIPSRGQGAELMEMI